MAALAFCPVNQRHVQSSPTEPLESVSGAGCVLWVVSNVNILRSVGAISYQPSAARLANVLVVLLADCFSLTGEHAIAVSHEFTGFCDIGLFHGN